MRLSEQEKKVFFTIKEKKLLSVKDRVLIAVSGGFDSVVLLNILNRLKNLLGIYLGIAHVNYNLREQDSIEEEVFVKNLSNSLNLEFHLLSVNPQDNLYNKNSLEENARNIRYSFFEKISKEYNYNKIAIAHNADDQAETVILNLIRGSISGLKGIEFIRSFSKKNTNLKVIRPLLNLSRKEIEDYNIKFDLNAKTDKSNLEDDYKRNRIRHHIIPLIKQENTNFLETLNNNCLILKEEDEYLQNIAKDIFNDSLIEKNSNYIIISQKNIIDNSNVIIRRVIKEAFFNLSGNSKSISSNRIEAVKNCIESNESGKTIELIEDYFFKKDRDYLVFMKNNIYKKFTPYLNKYFIDLSNKDEINIVSNTNIIEDKKISLSISKYSNNFTKNNIKTSILFSIDDSIEKFTLEIKNYDKNLEFFISDNNKKENLKDFYDKKKIPELLRLKTPIVTINDKIVWLLGIFRTNNLKIDSNKKIYKIELLQTCDN